jgi:glycerate kinase
MIKPSILVAPGPYKECLSSDEVAAAIKLGILDILPNSNVFVLPLSDGGSGITNVLTEATGGHIEKMKVHGPLGDEVDAFFGVLGDKQTVVIESASAAGLVLVPQERRNPLLTSTFGVGELIKAAVSYGAKNIIVGCGDSATNDCGIGCASALGVKFFDKNGNAIVGFLAGKDLKSIYSIDVSEVLKNYSDIKIIVACNLSSILCGQDGTSRIYGPQKGATPQQIETLEQGVEQFVEVVYKEFNSELAFIPGCGGAGGLAASLYAFFGAKLTYSIDVVDRYLNFDQYLKKVDLVLTGEGRIDDRTATGKVACGIALKAKRYNLPVVAIVGSIGENHDDIYSNGIDAVECIVDGPMTIQDSFANAQKLIRHATTRVMRYEFLKGKKSDG